MVGNPFEFKVTWDVLPHGEQRCVHEKINGEVGGSVLYGPMPRDFTGPFIDERKEFFADFLKRERERFVRI